MSGIVYKYPLDLTGTSPNNFEPSEKHTIGSTIRRIFIPDHGAFYGNSLVVRESVTGKVLEPIKDYILIHVYREAQEISAQPVYLGIRIVNSDVETELEIDVQYVGGEFSYSKKTIIEMLVNLENDNRPFQWGDLIGIPNEWVPAPHLHSAYDIYAMKHLVSATSSVESAIRDGYSPYISMIFEMMDDRISVFETLVPILTKAYRDASDELSTML